MLSESDNFWQIRNLTYFQNQLCWIRICLSLHKALIHHLSPSIVCPRPVDISYTGLEADVANLADGKKLVIYKYPPALALATPQAIRIRSHTLCVSLFGRTVIEICKLNCLDTKCTHHYLDHKNS